jgi:peroxiredoxin Q/BCP
VIEVGKKAPAFALKDQDGQMHRLADYTGKWVVLYFYPKDDTPGCTIEACEFTAGIRQFNKLDAVVLGCSADSEESHRKFIAKHKLKITLLSDPTHATMEKYGAWGEKNMYGKKTVGVIRSTVIIDPAGKVARHWKKVQSKGHADSVHDAVVTLAAYP